MSICTSPTTTITVGTLQADSMPQSRGSVTQIFAWFISIEFSYVMLMKKSIRSCRSWFSGGVSRIDDIVGVITWLEIVFSTLKYLY